jgi:alcohol dehydrogenase class IV
MSKVRVHRSPRVLITGIGSLEALGGEAVKLGATKACLVTDAGIAQSGLSEAAERQLADHGIAVDVYDRGMPVPTLEAVADCVAHIEAGGHDLIVAFGGASSSEISKLASVLVGSGTTPLDIAGLDKAPRKRVPLIAVPTTAGTGDEVTAIGEFTAPDEPRRRAVISDHLIPTVAIIDPVLTISCPPGITAAAGMDAFAHNVEAFISVHATLHTDSLTRQGVELIAKSLRTAVFDGEDIEARDNMAIGSVLGGIGYGNAGLGAVHALSYPLTARHHVPHGVANALIMPWVLEKVMLAGLDYFGQLGVAMGEPMAGLSQREQAQRTVLAMRHLVRDLELPEYLSDVGVPATGVEQLADDAMQHSRLLANAPRRLSRDDIVGIYLRAAVRPE